MNEANREANGATPALPAGGSGGDGVPSPALERQHKQREQQMRSHVHYLGFRSTGDGREYTVRVTGETSRLFVMLIDHQHFASGRARFQDGPDLCCTKLTQVLLDADADPADGRFALTAEDLLEYRTRHSTPTVGRRRERRVDEDGERTGSPPEAGSRNPWR